MMHTLADIAIILGQSPELSLVVKMTIAATLGLAVVRYARAARASVRHLVLTSTFAAMLALPVAMLIVPAIAIELPSATTTANDTTAAQPAAASVSIEAHSGAPRNASGNDAGQNTRDTRAESRSGFMIWLTAVGRATGFLASADDADAASSANAPFTPMARVPWLAMIRAVWLAGAALLLGMFAIAVFRLRAVRRAGLPWLERRDDVARVATEVGVNRPVTVMLHERIAAPLTCGWRNPVIVLPADAREWSEGDVRRVLLHELEHVRRGDWMVQLAARAICAIYWFHPLVWTAWRQLCLEAERACDDAVVKSEAGPDYAEQLVMLARRMSDASTAHPMVAMASRSDLSARVTALLDQRQQRGRAGIMTFVAAVGAAAIIVITIGPLQAVAADVAQAGDPVIADGRGSGSGSGVGSGHGSGSGIGVGNGAGNGAGQGSAIGAPSPSSAAIAGFPGAPVGGVASGVGVGVSEGVAGGKPGGVVGGVPGGVVDGTPGGVIGGVTGGVVGGVSGSRAPDRLGVVADGQKVVEEKVVGEKRRVSRTDRALGEALIEAAGDGDVRALDELLAPGIDVNMRVSGDGSALIAAARNGQIGAMKYLLERGADVNMAVEGDGNPLIAAAANGQIAAVTMLLERGANLEAIVDGDENALIQAAGGGHLAVVKLLVGRGANVNASVRVDMNRDGEPKTGYRTPLSMARRGGHAAVVAFLQSAGAVQ